jgi:acetolactate decarboxylase
LQIDLLTKRVAVLPGTYPGANGLAYEASRQLVYLTTMGPDLDGTGKLYVKSAKDSAALFTPLPGSPTGLLDGVTLIPPQHLLLSDWVGLKGEPGKLYVFDQVGHTFRPLPFSPGSPADFYVDTQTNRLFIPQTLTHRLTVVDLPEIGRLSGQTDRVLSPPDCLFHAGVWTAFLGGLYDGHYPYGALKTHGDFGLGAPDKLDGELTIYGGSVLQTQHTGRTFEAADTAKTAYAFVHFFRPNQALSLTQPLNSRQVEALLDSLLPDANGMYALTLEGTFRMVQTRAFPPVGEAPYAPLVTMLDKQRFFDFTQVPGVLVGYRLPALLRGINIPGYHFHFISRDHQGAGT